MKKIIFCLVLFCIYPFNATLTAHPHVKITSNLEFDYEGEVCKGFWVHWEFDDYFGMSIVEEFDLDKDGKFSKKENNDIYNEAFSNLVNYGYFIFIRKGKNRFNPSEVSDFKAHMQNKHLFYSFYVPISDTKLGKDFYVSVFDRTFYCATYFQDRPVSINQKSGKSPKVSVETNKNYPVYYNPTGASDDTTVYTEWKAGLETAYPDEVHVCFE